jgi:hypothetical protein
MLIKSGNYDDGLSVEGDENPNYWISSKKREGIMSPLKASRGGAATAKFRARKG